MKNKSFLTIFLIIFTMSLSVSVMMKELPAYVLVVYVAMSLITFSVYWVDKSAARKNKWRSKDSTLQILALSGGWPGALLGQQFFRHKSSKRSFQLKLWLMVMLNISLLVWVLFCWV